MLRLLVLGWLVLAACGGETSLDPQMVKSEDQLTSDAAARVFDSGLHDAGPFDAGHPDASTWLAASQFSITLDSGACYGTCPHYWVRFDSSGKLSYRGRSHTAKPGYFEIDLPATDAEALRVSMIDAGFLGLQASYQTEADGCKSVSTDASTKTIGLVTPTQTKQVTLYEGCDTHAAWLFHQLEKQIMRATQVGRFLYPSLLWPCMREGEPDFHRSWVISNSLGGPEQEDLGLLRIEDDYTWTVTTCDGREIFSGHADRHANWDRMLISRYDEPGPIMWPGTEGPQGVALLSRTSLDGWISIRVVNLIEEHRQYAHEGERCGGP